jgi:uroporphyrinogen-III synthase
VTSSTDRPLTGRVVAVTRAPEQAAELVDALVALGARVLEIPTIAIVDAPDDSAALAAAVDHLNAYTWIVLTSANGARRFVAAAPPPPWPPVAVVGPKTADALAVTPALVPDRFVAEALLEVFPTGTGRVLLAQAAGAGPLLAEGLKVKGWTVDAVTAYATEPVRPTRELLDALAAADALTLTSGSASVVLEGQRLPPVVVAIGPVTAAAARDRGIEITAVAEPHTVEGIVAAVTQALQRVDG